MQSSTNNFVRGLREDIESTVRLYYPINVKIAFENEAITEQMRDIFLSLKPIDMDELEDAVRQLHHAIKHSEYYTLLERIEKGENMLETETDPKKKLQYSKLLNDLTTKLEELRPA